jgi:hypothetical protein
MFAPRLIIVLWVITEGAENTFKVMLVLQSNVLFNSFDTSRLSVFRKKCACHTQRLSRLQPAGRAPTANTTIVTVVLGHPLAARFVAETTLDPKGFLLGIEPGDRA